MSLNDAPNSARTTIDVEYAGGQTLQTAVLPVLSPSAHDVELLTGQLLVQLLKFAGIVLKIGVHRQDVIASRHAEAAREGWRLAEVFPERKDPYLALGTRQGSELVERVVG